VEASAAQDRQKQSRITDSMRELPESVDRSTEVGLHMLTGQGGTDCTHNKV